MIHMEMFDLKDTFNKKVDELDAQTRRLTGLNEEKINEINQLADKNHNLSNLQKKTESELKSITEKLRNIEAELSQRIMHWKKSKENYLDIIKEKKSFFENNYPLKEYNSTYANYMYEKSSCNIFSAVENIIKKKNIKANYFDHSQGSNYLSNNSASNANSLATNIEGIGSSIASNRTEKNLNFLNAEFILKFYDKYALQLKYFSSLINNFNSNLINNLDTLIESLIEHVNFLHSNVELKNEHRGYLYPLDKLKMHLFCLQQIIRTIAFFIKILIKKIENFLVSNLAKINTNRNQANYTGFSGNLNNTLIQIYTNINILIFLFNKAVSYTDLIGRYFSVMLREERKIVNIDADSDFFSNRTKINKNLKILSNKFFQNLKIMTKYLNATFNFDVIYHLKNMRITSDNSAMIIITVNENYLKNLTFVNLAKAAEGIRLFNKYFIVEFSKNFKNNLSELFKQFELKLELEYKMFEIIKEENKHKYNYPVINLSSLRMNNENIKKSLKEITQFFSQELFKQTIQLFKVASWEYGENTGINNTSSNSLSSSSNNNNSNNNNFFSQGNFSSTNAGLFASVNYGEILVSIFSNRVINFLTQVQLEEKNLIKAYLAAEPGIDYEEAIRNKNILREMLEKENKAIRDKENYVIKLSEYEEDLKKLREQVTIQQNELDICSLKLLEAKSVSSFNITSSTKEMSTISEQSSNIDGSSDPANFNNSISSKSANYPHFQSLHFSDTSSDKKFECSLKELVQYGINLSELPKEILSDDVQSGKQRSSFKLSDKDNRPIPLTKFTSKLDNINITEDLNVLYHRKILEKIQKYSAKIKNIDVKVIANIQSEDIKREYEEKTSVLKNSFITEINELKEKIGSVELSNTGYKENIEFLTNIMVDFQELKENVSKCGSCLRFIKALDARK